MRDSAAKLTEEVEESEGASVEAIEEEADEEESTLSSTGNEFLDSGKKQNHYLHFSSFFPFRIDRFTRLLYTRNGGHRCRQP